MINNDLTFKINFISSAKICREIINIIRFIKFFNYEWYIVSICIKTIINICYNFQIIFICRHFNCKNIICNKFFAYIIFHLISRFRILIKTKNCRCLNIFNFFFFNISFILNHCSNITFISSWISVVSHAFNSAIIFGTNSIIGCLCISRNNITIIFHAINRGS